MNINGRILNQQEIDACRRAIANYYKSDERWKMFFEKPRKIKEIREMCKIEMGEGGSAALEWIPEWHNGNNNPRIWLGKYTPEGEPDFTSKDVFELARLLFDSKYSQVKQLTLF